VGVQVDFRNEQALAGLVLAGQQAVFEWMLAHPHLCPPAQLNAFRESCVQYREVGEDGRPKKLLNLARLAEAQSVAAVSA
jgi:hypothetical protein